MPLDSRQIKTHNDAKNSSSLVGKVFYQKNEKDSRYFRTVRIGHNPFANAMTPEASNWVYGEPPDELDPLPPLLQRQLFTIPNSWGI